MTQNASDVEIANQGFAAFRQDLNDVLEDITTLHSGTAAPSTTYANQWWYETDTDKLYIRNEDNDAWVEILTIDQANDKLASLGVILHIDDTGSTKQLEIQAPNTVNNHTQLRFNSQYYQYWDITNDAGELKFGRGGTDYVTIDSSGNTGIGTILPASSISGSATVLQIDDNNIASIALNNTGANTKFEIASAASDALVFTDNGSERLRIQSGGGISFNGDTAAANALDDYEEGFWTPTFSRGGTALSPTPSYSTREGTYTKIGDFVHVSCEVRFNNNFSGGSGSYLMSNLPFTAENQLDGISWGLMTVFNNTWTFSSTFAYVAGTTVQFSSNMSLASSTNDQYLCFSAHYKTA